MEDTEIFSVGYFKNATKSEVLMNYIDAFGVSNGHAVIKIQDIFKIEYDGKYSKKTQMLNTFESQTPTDILINSDALLDDLIAHAYQENKIITIELLKGSVDEFTGYLEEFKDEIIIVKQVNIYGEFDGTVVVKKEDITCIICDSAREVALKRLNTFIEN